MLDSNSTPDGRCPVRPTEEQFALLAEVIRSVARQRRLSRDDELDFGQCVHLRLLEAGYRQLGQFAGLSSLRTFLHVVVRRMFLDWQRSLHGKWRPSAAARKLGTYGTLLERLIHRDGHAVHEAVQMVDTHNGAPEAQVLRELAAALPPRRRLRMVPLESLHENIGAQSEDPVEQSERQARVGDVRRVLRQAFRELPIEDRKLLALRYHGQQRVATTASALRVDAKALHRRYQRLLRRLRRALEDSGIVGSTCDPTIRPNIPLSAQAWQRHRPTGVSQGMH